MKIAFIGCRGIPRCYSGFETAVEEISTRLAARGQEVTVYNRIPFNPYREKTFKGVRIVALPTLPTKATDTIVHTALCSLHAASQRYDIIYLTGVGNAIFAGWFRALGRKVLVNVDGADWARAKWRGFGRWWLRWSEGRAARLAHAVIADHPCIAQRYQEQFGIQAEVISYGAEVVETDPGRDWLRHLGLAPKEYFLFVSRLTPENGADQIMEAWLRSGVKLPLVVVGDAPYQSAYKTRLLDLQKASHGRILLPGFVFGEGYRQLSYHALAYLFPTAIDATRPVLLEQMGFGAAIISRDTPANRHVLQKAAWYYNPEEPGSLAALMQRAEKNPEDLLELGHLARERIREHYNWDGVTSQYEELFQKWWFPREPRA